jgi:hypothetical protein
MTTSHPYPNAQSPADILTDDQKRALDRLGMQSLIAHLEARPSQVQEEHWPKIMRANLPRVVAAVADNLIFGEWIDRANALITANQAALQPE